jgi:hypothetical protein
LKLFCSNSPIVKSYQTFVPTSRALNANLVSKFSAQQSVWRSLGAFVETFSKSPMRTRGKSLVKPLSASGPVSISALCSLRTVVAEKSAHRVTRTFIWLANV